MTPDGKRDFEKKTQTSSNGSTSACRILACTVCFSTHKREKNVIICYQQQVLLSSTPARHDETQSCRLHHHCHANDATGTTLELSPHCMAHTTSPWSVACSQCPRWPRMSSSVRPFSSFAMVSTTKMPSSLTPVTINQAGPQSQLTNNVIDYRRASRILPDRCHPIDNACRQRLGIIAR